MYPDEAKHVETSLFHCTVNKLLSTVQYILHFCAFPVVVIDLTIQNGPCAA